MSMPIGTQANTWPPLPPQPEHARRLRRLQERLAAACRRPVDDIAADMRVGRLLSAHEAQGYGLVDTTEPPGRQQVS
jgi:ATP-dependent Clp protease protease subunit